MLQICFCMYEPRAAMIGHGRVLLRPSGIASCTARIADLMFPFATGQFEAHVNPARNLARNLVWDAMRRRIAAYRNRFRARQTCTKFAVAVPRKEGPQILVRISGIQIIA